MRLTLTNRSNCQYYGPGGLMCAVGCLIPEEEYSSDFEGESVEVIQAKVPTIYGLNLALLSDMQFVHDYDDIASWEKQFQELANHYNLTLPPLEATHA